jgi:hypothetical protein
MSAAAKGPGDVRLNEVQVLGSHNSYHIEPVSPLLLQLGGFDQSLADSIEYTHLPLTEQFETQGIRQIELDVFADPNGGIYSQRAGLILIGQSPISTLPELQQPGFKVLHVQDMDFETTCLTFVDCLQEVKDWSDANPRHLPIMILVEAKDDPIDIDVGLNFIVPLEIGPAELDALDAEILSVFPTNQLITPDDVRGTRDTLEKAILRDGWPTLRESRGKVLFALDNGGEEKTHYLAGHPSLEGRVMFVSGSPGDPEAAFAKRNDPLSDPNEIPDLVAGGYLVRTRADSDTDEARSGDTTKRDEALASGGQYVSTDYPVPDPAFGTGYFVSIPGGTPGRCNPINGPADCQSSALENLTGSQPVFGKKIVMRDKEAEPGFRKLVLLAKDVLFDTYRTGGSQDPSAGGATIEISSNTQTAVILVPGGPNWTALGNPPGAKGYKYRDPELDDGACKVVIAKPGVLFRAVCFGAGIGFALSDDTQDAIDVTVQLGDDQVHCMSFSSGSGTILKDEGTGIKPTGVGLFKAKDATAPGSCPP